MAPAYQPAPGFQPMPDNAPPLPPKQVPYVTQRPYDPNEERTFAMLTHLAALASLIVPLGGVVGPLILWLVKKDQYPLVDQNGRQSLNFQISLAIYTLGLLGVLFIVILVMTFVAGGSMLMAGPPEGPQDMDSFAGGFIGAGLFILLFVLVAFGLTILNVVLIIIGSIRANARGVFRYPLAIPFFRAAAPTAPAAFRSPNV